MTEEYQKLISFVITKLTNSNAVLVDFDSVKGYYNILNKHLAIIKPDYLSKLDRVDAFLWFPITCNNTEFYAWREVMYGSVPYLRLPCKVNRLYLVETVSSTVKNFIRNIPLIKNMKLDGLLCPNDEIDNFTVIRWINL